MEQTGEMYVALKTTCWRRDMVKWADRKTGDGCAREAGEMRFVDERELILVPYYARANRGGRGHLRVGFVRGD